jgi:predicted acyltransferase
MEVKDIHEKIERLFIIGTVLTFAGFLLSYGCPINKKVWSPTFVLTTCGLASSFLALLVWFIDVKGYKKWSRFFESFGVNPLFIYVTAAVFSILLININFPYAEDVISLHGYAYTVVLQPALGDYAGSLAFALLFVALNWVIGHVLYKKKIYNKDMILIADSGSTKTDWSLVDKGQLVQRFTQRNESFLSVRRRNQYRNW